jgi:hypothetical protein
MNKLMVSFWGWGGDTDEDIIFCHAAKTIAGSHMRVAMGDLMVWAQKLDLSLHLDTIGKPRSRAFDSCNKNVVVLQRDDSY